MRQVKAERERRLFFHELGAESENFASSYNGENMTPRVEGKKREEKIEKEDSKFPTVISASSKPKVGAEIISSPGLPQQANGNADHKC